VIYKTVVETARVQMKTKEALLRLRLDNGEVSLVLASKNLHNAK
jgi:hypothetical protein